MPTSGIDDLQPITELLRERAFDALRRRSADLARLSGEIAEIDRMRQEARDVAGDADARRMLGMDTLWYDWTLQRRADLLSRSAMARAHEAEAQSRAREAFSRHAAAQALLKAECDAEQERRRAMAQASLDALIVLKGFQVDPESTR